MHRHSSKKTPPGLLRPHRLAWLVLAVFGVALALSPGAQASPVSSYCSGALERLFSWRPSTSRQLIASEEVNLWNTTFREGGPYRSSSLLNGSDPMSELAFWWLMRSLPNEIIRVLDGTPIDRQAALKYFRKIQAALPEVRYFDTYLNVVERRYTQSSFGEKLETAFFVWRQQGLQRLEQEIERQPQLKVQLVHRIKNAAHHSKNQDQWRTKAGIFELPVTIEGSRVRLQLGPHTLEGRLDGDGVLLSIPRELVAHPAWNPVSVEKVSNMAQTGVRPPKSYPLVLGHDGKFYFTDGNHRFEVDNSERIIGRLGWPLKTGPYSTTFDLLGWPQPKPEAIDRFMSGEIALDELAPPGLGHLLVIGRPRCSPFSSARR